MRPSRPGAVRKRVRVRGDRRCGRWRRVAIAVGSIAAAAAVGGAAGFVVVTAVGVGGFSVSDFGATGFSVFATLGSTIVFAESLCGCFGDFRRGKFGFGCSFLSLCDRGWRVWFWWRGEQCWCGDFGWRVLLR